MPIRELFASDVTRDISPVVYFHEQSPDKLAQEVEEYIITGGWPENHPHHRRVPDGIHEQYVRLLTAITAELERKGGPPLPNCWISGFYGSGKSSFAKLLGYALDGRALPDGTSLAEALLKRDTSPRAAELREAWAALRKKVDPVAVVFDVGSEARDDEHIHATAMRQVQAHLQYCVVDPQVADFELRLEREGDYPRFLETAEKLLDGPWHVQRSSSFADEDFSIVMHAMYPQRYTDENAWFRSRGGRKTVAASPADAVAAIADMMKFRQADKTLFLVVDEVSQFVLSSNDRVERLRAFAEQLGARMKGKAWLLALGQQKLDDEADAGFIIHTKDRFPPKLRVHLAATNIRDVVHKRLLAKNHAGEDQLRTLFKKHRADLKLFAYGGDAITEDDFVETYPLLPKQIDLLLQLTTQLRLRSNRSQKDDQTIRGLLQLLGELFRERKLADAEVGTLVTLDEVYEVQGSALDSDTQNSMRRILEHCADDAAGLQVRVAKAVALLQVLSDVKTDAALVAKCLFDRVDRGSQVDAIGEALEELRRKNLLGYSEKSGYSLQSSAAEEWERDRRDIGVSRETIAEAVQESLELLLAKPDRPKLEGRPFPWAGVFSDGRRNDDVSLLDSRDPAALRVDFRYLPQDQRAESTWVKRSDETELKTRLLWVAGDVTQVDELARELARSRAMIRKHKPIRESLNEARKVLLIQEESRADDLYAKVQETVAEAFMAGSMFFRGRVISPHDHGTSFSTALQATGTRILPDLFPNFVPTPVDPSEMLQLIQPELSGVPPKFMADELGILRQEGNRYVPSCDGVVPARIIEHIEREGGLSGANLIATFGGPPYGYTADLVKSCVAGLLRAGRVRITVPGTPNITAVRDPGVKDLFDKDRQFRSADIFPKTGSGGLKPQDRARICAFFQESLDHGMDREDNAIANAVTTHFPQLASRLRDVLARHRQVPGAVDPPPALKPLDKALEECVAKSRFTEPTVAAVKKHLDALRDGVQLLRAMDAELTPDVIAAVRSADDVRKYQLQQLRDLGEISEAAEEGGQRIEVHLAHERPWREITALDEDLERIREEYVAKRKALLVKQDEDCGFAREAVKSRDGFATLTGDQSHKVLRPIDAAKVTTGERDVGPTLSSLRDGFVVALKRAEELANEHLDEILSEGDKPLIRRFDPKLKNRELSSKEDVKALLDELEKRLLEALKDGARVRLL